MGVAAVQRETFRRTSRFACCVREMPIVKQDDLQLNTDRVSPGFQTGFHARIFSFFKPVLELPMIIGQRSESELRTHVNQVEQTLVVRAPIESRSVIEILAPRYGL